MIFAVIKQCLLYNKEALLFIPSVDKSLLTYAHVAYDSADRQLVALVDLQQLADILEPGARCVV